MLDPVPQSFEIPVRRIRQTCFDKLTIRGGRILAVRQPGPVAVMILIGDPVHLPALAGVAPVAAVAIGFRCGENSRIAPKGSDSRLPGLRGAVAEMLACRPQELRGPVAS